MAQSTIQAIQKRQTYRVNARRQAELEDTGAEFKPASRGKGFRVQLGSDRRERRTAPARAVLSEHT